jgi:hypothetical protein
VLKKDEIQLDVVSNLVVAKEALMTTLQLRKDEN